MSISSTARIHSSAVVEAGADIGAGCEIGTIAGPAEWASEDAFKLIKAATAK